MLCHVVLNVRTRLIFVASVHLILSFNEIFFILSDHLSISFVPFESIGLILDHFSEMRLLGD